MIKTIKYWFQILWVRIKLMCGGYKIPSLDKVSNVYNLTDSRTDLLPKSEKVIAGYNTTRKRINKTWNKKEVK